jgi:hypothetical protein
VSSPPLSPEDGNRSRFRNVAFSRIPDNGKSPKNPVILSVIHHRQNRLQSTKYKLHVRSLSQRYIHTEMNSQPWQWYAHRHKYVKLKSLDLSKVNVYTVVLPQIIQIYTLQLTFNKTWHFRNKPIHFRWNYNCFDRTGLRDRRNGKFTHSLIHSWSWALLEKLPIVQPLKNFPAFYGTRKFITAFTRALHWSLSLARSIQSIPSHPISLRSILILSTHLRLGLPSGIFPSGFPTNLLYAFLFSPFVLHAVPISSSLNG